MNIHNTILLVDYDEPIHYVIQLILDKLEVTGKIKSAYSGDEGLQYLQKYSGEANFPKLIITNINMKGMNGIEFIRKVKQLKGFTAQKTEIFVLSPELKESEVKELENLEVDRILLKPLLPATYNQLKR